MSLNILLIDDEYIVLKGLEIVLREQKEISLNIETALSAIDAIEKLNTYHPDVIITDINMPELNGLDMLEQISDRYPKCSFIIISGYDDQNYLKHALRLHVADYLTKPIDKLYLIQRLKEINEEKQRSLSHTLLKIRLMLSSEEQSLTLQEFGHLFPLPYFALCVAPISLQEADKKQIQISHYFESCEIFPLNDWSVFLMNYSAKIPEEEVRKLLRSFFDREFCGITLFPLPEYDDLLSAGNLLSIYPYLQKALVDLILSTLPMSDSTRKSVTASISARSLQPIMQVLIFENDITDYVEEIWRTEQHKSICFPIAFTETLAGYILKFGTILSTDTILNLYTTSETKIQNKRHLASFLEQTLNLHYNSISLTKNSSYSDKITAACKYLEQHYTEDITLDELAAYVSANPSYLSYLFKKETGITFLQYLTNTRLQKACQIMTEEPDLSLENIAVRSVQDNGKNPRYIMKKLTLQIDTFGNRITPVEWRLKSSILQAISSAKDMSCPSLNFPKTWCYI